jgi:hypothetical protein
MNTANKERLFLRQWVGEKISVKTIGVGGFSGNLTNIVFDQSNRLTYIMLDEKHCINFDHIINISLEK